MEKITVDLISSKEFSIESKGYNRQEVDNFLDDICEEIERMENEIRDLRQKTTAVRPAAQPQGGSTVTPEQEKSFREILELAIRVKDETIQKAKEDAEAIRAKAEAEATERLNGLNLEQEALKKEVAALKETSKTYRASFEALLQSQQEALEKATNLF